VGRARLFARPWVIAREYHRVVKEQVPTVLTVQGDQKALVHFRLIIDPGSPLSAQQEASLLRILKSGPRR
jgi:hypothetical protein